MIIRGDYFWEADKRWRLIGGCKAHQRGSRSGDAVPERELRCGSAVVHSDLRQDARDVYLHRIGAEEEPLRDLPIAQPGGHEPEHLDFARGQSRGKLHAHGNGFASRRESGLDPLRMGESETRVHRGADGAYFIEYDRGRRAVPLCHGKFSACEQSESSLVGRAARVGKRERRGEMLLRLTTEPFVSNDAAEEAMCREQGKRLPRGGGMLKRPLSVLPCARR